MDKDSIQYILDDLKLGLGPTRMWSEEESERMYCALSRAWESGDRNGKINNLLTCRGKVEKGKIYCEAYQKAFDDQNRQSWREIIVSFITGALFGVAIFNLVYAIYSHW